MPAPFGNKNAIGNKGGGRKPKYRPEYAAEVLSLALLGLTDEEIGEHFGVNGPCICKWQKKHVEFGKAVKDHPSVPVFLFGRFDRDRPDCSSVEAALGSAWSAA